MFCIKKEIMDREFPLLRDEQSTLGRSRRDSLKMDSCLRQSFSELGLPEPVLFSPAVMFIDSLIFHPLSLRVGLPGRASGKESACQCRGHRFSLWAGKIPWRRKWHATPVFLSGESHGQRCLACCGVAESDRSDYAHRHHSLMYDFKYSLFTSL